MMGRVLINKMENKYVKHNYAFIDGKEIKEYLGVVTGKAISGANFVKDFLASIKDFTLGKMVPTKKNLEKIAILHLMK